MGISGGAERDRTVDLLNAMKRRIRAGAALGAVETSDRERNELRMHSSAELAEQARSEDVDDVRGPDGLSE